MQFKLTFNKPAFKMFFEGEDAKGIRVKVIEGVAYFQPHTSKSGGDVVPITERGRGGVEAVIEGHLADQLLNALKNPHGNSFFMLTRNKGWIQTTPYNGTKDEPPRFQPQVRVWAKETVRPFPTHLVNDIQNMGMAQFLSEVREAKDRIADYDAQKKPGRPPREVSEARDLLRLFAEVAREVLPLETVRQAHALLGQYLGHDETEGDEAETKTEARAEPKETKKERQAAQPSAPQMDLPEPPSAPAPAPTSTKTRAVAKQSAPKGGSRRTRAAAMENRDPEEERMAQEAAQALGVPVEGDQRVKPKRRLKQFSHA